MAHDKELEADVFEELDDEHQVEFLRERSDEQVAEVLARMATDDVADLLLEIEQDRGCRSSSLLPAAKQRKIRGLLGHNPSTAGGLMNPDFVVGAGRRTRPADALGESGPASSAPQQVAVVCVVDEDGVLLVSAGQLVRAGPSSARSACRERRPAVGAEAELPEVARLMADYNLVAMPVLDDEAPGRDRRRRRRARAADPEEWRRRCGLARE